MTAHDLQNALQRILGAPDALMDADATDDQPWIRRVETYQEAGILSHDAGLVVEVEDGRQFQITIIRSR